MITDDIEEIREELSGFCDTTKHFGKTVTDAIEDLAKRLFELTKRVEALEAKAK